MSKCSKKLELYFKKSTSIPDLKAENDLRCEIIDYIELTLYSAAEHVDDIKAIARGFFKDKINYDRSKHVTKLLNTLKQHKNLITVSANAIKHNQSRIRLFSQEFTHSGEQMCLHGYFIEAVSKGVVGLVQYSTHRGKFFQ